MGLSNQDATAVVTNNGLRTQYGLILPPGARVAAYVRSTGFQSGDDAFLVANLYPTLAQGLAKARAGLGDFVVCLPGHVENVADATTFSGALLAGTKILGVGKGSNTPTFTWTATASQWNVTVNDVFIGGLRLLFDGINAVVNAINVTGADFTLAYNDIEVSTTAKAPTACVTLNAGANRAQIQGNVFRGNVPAAVATDGILVNAAVLDIAIEDNEMVFPSTAASGSIRVAAAALGMKILRNYIYNTTASSTACIAFGPFAADGILDANILHGTNATGGSTLLSLGANALVRLGQNFGATTVRTTGVLNGTASS